MRIALLTDGIYPYVMGGMQRHSFYLAKYLARAGVHVDLYHFIPPSAKAAQLPFTQSELELIDLIEVNYPRSVWFPGHYIYNRRRYSHRIYDLFVQRQRPDYVFIQGFTGLYFLSNKRAKVGGVKIGVHFHGYEMFQPWPDIKTGLKLQLLKGPVRFSIRRADQVFSLGGQISDIIGNLGVGDKLIELPIGIGSDWITSEPQKSNEVLRFVFVGRDERRKGIKELYTALDKLDDHQFEFHLIGPLSKARFQDERMTYHGEVRDASKVKAVLDSMDVLVCPSYSEGMPNVIMEAMARGLAIIATNVGAVSAQVDSSNGWLLPKPDPNMIFAAMEEAINLNQEELHLKKQSSLERVRSQFTWEKVIEQTLQAIS